jgi:hypothetical protein
MAASRLATWSARLLVASGVATAGVALFHAAAIVVPGISEPSPAWRHALFIGVNAFFAWAFVTRVAWLPIPFVVLAAQQTWSHGSAFLDARAAGHFDLQSVLVLVSLPFLAIFIALGRKRPGARAA